MRILGGRNLFEFDDLTSESNLGLYYRMPTTEEFISYRNGGTKRVDGELVNCRTENRIEHGLKILTGVRDGDFGKPGPDGTPLPISSDKSSENYDPDWKQHVEDSAADLIEIMGCFVFEASAKAILPGTSVKGKGKEKEAEATEDPE